MTNLLYTEIEESLRESVRGTIARHLSPEATANFYDEPQNWAPTAWKSLTEELGVAGLLVPEDSGGAGAGPREAAVVLEEIGRAVAPVPYLTSSVIATTVLLEAGDTTHVPALAAGEVTASLVLPWSARPGAWSSAAPEDSVQPVAGALGADLLLVPVTGADGLELRVLRAEEGHVEPLVSLDMSRPLASVTVPEAGEVLVTGERARAAVESGLAAGTALLSSEQYGLASWCLETTVDYAKTRIQFARPIGSFQAIKHRLADLYLEVSQSCAAARYAAATLATGDPDAAVARGVAQAYCSDAAVHAAEEAVQLHGGNGMTWEYPVHLYLKRAKANQLALGTHERHREDLGPLVNLPR